MRGEMKFVGSTTLHKGLLWQCNVETFQCTCHKDSRLRCAKAQLERPASFQNKLWTDEIKLSYLDITRGGMHGE